jgi:hypothetical protein
MTYLLVTQMFKKIGNEIEKDHYIIKNYDVYVLKRTLKLFDEKGLMQIVTHKEFLKLLMKGNNIKNE